MHDLRRQALESGKTVSRKARSRVVSAKSSKPNSRLNSPAHSRAGSRNVSRQGSDDEDYFSDETAMSANSIDDILNSDDADISDESWQSDLQTYIEQIVDRKGSSTDGRAASLASYAHTIMTRYAKDEVESRMDELVPSMVRSIKQETSEDETTAALKALGVTIITLDSDTIYDDVADVLKNTISHSESVTLKTGAIHTLGTAAYFGGTSEEEIEDLLTYFLEIVESDGLSANAHDEPSVVTAALEQWGLLATVLDDAQEATDAAIEAFVDQLESADVNVQIAAGENIALMFEKSYTPIEAGEKLSEDEVEDDETPPGAEKMIKRYDVYRRPDQLMHTLDQLAKASDRSISKKDRKSLHSNFADIRKTVEKPTRGPGYSTAIDQETGKMYGGGRLKFQVLMRRFNCTAEVKLDRWWKLRVYSALKKQLAAGFSHHFDENEAVSRCLPSYVTTKHWKRER
ncbi:IFRD domain-containing protein [Byssothecium circinans]|uniref:IFRD domain-containing protein n=1 Tax=Byssothecium circinans TaxID=147558 RepID=A0A6A5TFK1_9PLEO|nr:IFRD domain-containing protein [Byssothecium circinans]